MPSTCTMNLQNSTPINDNSAPVNDSNDAPKNANANPRNTDQRGKEAPNNSHTIPKASPHAHILHQTQLLNKTLFSQFTPFFQWNYVFPNLSNNPSNAAQQRQSLTMPTFPSIAAVGNGAPLSEEAIRLATTALLSNSLAADPNFLQRAGQIMDPTSSLPLTFNKPMNNEQNISEQSISLPGNLQLQQYQQQHQHQQLVEEAQYVPNPQVSQFIQDFLDLIIPDLALEVIEDAVHEQFNMIATPYAIDFHRERSRAIFGGRAQIASGSTTPQSNKASSKRSARKKVEKLAVGIDDEQTDVSEEEQDEAVDPLRKHLLREWKEEISQYDWRFEWLCLRTKQLQFERDEIDLELQAIKQRQSEPDYHKNLHEQNKFRSPGSHKRFAQESPVLRRKILTTRVYPPEKRREDISNHPIFSPFKRSKNVPLAGLTREDIVASLNIFQNPEPKSSNNRKKRPRGLSVDIPVGNEQLPKRMKKYASNSTGKSARSNKRSLSSSSSSSSAQKGKADFQEFYVPWSDVRSNIIIEEVKPKEIFTPSWRSAELLNGFDIDNEDDESDEFYVTLHLPLEIEERRKTWMYMEGGNEKRKKKKRDTNSGLLQTPIQSDEGITNLFVQHSDVVSPITPFHQPNTPNNGKQSVLSPGNGSATPSFSKNEKIPRYLQISKESYVPCSFPCPKSILGNWEELKTKHEEIEQEKLRFAEEQALLRISGAAHKPAIEEEFVDDFLATDSLVVSDDEFDLEGWRSGDDDYEFHDESSADSEASEPSDFEPYSPSSKRRRRERSKRKPKENYTFEVFERTGPLSIIVRRVPK